MRALFASTFMSVVLLTGCSSSARQTKIYAAGEKATVDKLTYSVVDTEFQTHLGDESSPRNPQNRFVVVQLAVSNAGNTDTPIPGLVLVDDGGKTYPELADGTGVPQWLGVIRKVGPGQTERGTVVFDAPAGHYKLKLSDETDSSDVYADIPLNFVHEQMNDAAAAAQTPDTSTMQKKK